MPKEFKTGTVSKVRDKFFVTVGKRKMEIPVGPITTAAELGKLVGKEVQVALSGGRSSAVVAINPGGRRPHCYWITCYIIARGSLAKVNNAVRRALVEALVDQKVITADIGKEIKAGLQ